jgi:hypothetical protein
MLTGVLHPERIRQLLRPRLRLLRGYATGVAVQLRHLLALHRRYVPNTAAAGALQGAAHEGRRPVRLLRRWPLHAINNSRSIPNTGSHSPNT